MGTVLSRPILTKPFLFVRMPSFSGKRWKLIRVISTMAPAAPTKELPSCTHLARQSASWTDTSNTSKQSSSTLNKITRPRTDCGAILALQMAAEASNLSFMKKSLSLIAVLCACVAIDLIGCSRKADARGELEKAAATLEKSDATLPAHAQPGAPGNPAQVT